MRAADWVILVIILASTIQAIRAGFFREAFGIAGLVLGYLLAAWKYSALAGWLEGFLKSQAFAEVAGFLVIFLAVTILASVAGRVARWAAKESGLSFVDRILGGALGLLRGCLVVAVVLMAMTAFSPASQWLQDSRLAPYFLVVGRAAIWVAPSEMRARFYQGLDLLHHAAQPVTSPAPGK
ncbi:MAG TPA: CvpA family protein [Terriglobales bacterium]|nr:CvpA family protein [Terriglobales bacterium]